MSTVAQVADRAFRDFLAPAEQQPIIVTLTSAVDASTTSFAYDDSTLAPDEESALSPGVLIEVDTELCRIRAVDDSGDTLTVTRGVNGTTAASHDDGAEVVVAPVFARSTLVDAVKDNVVALYPTLWRTTTTTLTISSGQAEVPAAVVTPVGATYLSNGRPRSITVELLDPWPPSSTGKSILTYDAPSGTSVYFTYRGKFDRPDDDDDLNDLGVRPEWERIVEVGAVAQVVAGRDLDSLTAEYLTEQLERDALPMGGPQQVRNGLLTLYNIWLQDAHRNLRNEAPPPTVVMT